MTPTTEVPDTTTLMEAANMAQCAHLRLITDGQRTVLSPIALPGFRPVIVKVKPLPLGEVRDAA